MGGLRIRNPVRRGPSKSTSSPSTSASAIRWKLGLVADVKATVAALLPLLQQKADSAFLTEAQTRMREWRALAGSGLLRPQRTPLRPQMVMRRLSDALAPDAVISLDCGANTHFAARIIELREGQQLTGTGMLATMAPGLPLCDCGAAGLSEASVGRRGRRRRLLTAHGGAGDGGQVRIAGQDHHPEKQQSGGGAVRAEGIGQSRCMDAIWRRSILSPSRRPAARTDSNAAPPVKSKRRFRRPCVRRGRRCSKRRWMPTRNPRCRGNYGLDRSTRRRSLRHSGHRRRRCGTGEPARALADGGQRVAVLEARDRIGGRISRSARARPGAAMCSPSSSAQSSSMDCPGDLGTDRRRRSGCVRVAGRAFVADRRPPRGARRVSRRGDRRAAGTRSLGQRASWPRYAIRAILAAGASRRRRRRGRVPVRRRFQCG